MLVHVFKKIHLLEIEKLVTDTLPATTSRIFKTAALAIIGVAMAVSCQHDPFETMEPVDEDPTDTTSTPTDTSEVTGHPCSDDSIYFKRDLLPILLGNCAMTGCHDPDTARGGVVLHSYDSIMSTAGVVGGDPDNSRLYQVITATDPNWRMPYQMDALPASDIITIQKWISQGALFLECDDPAFCDTLGVTYSGYVSGVLTGEGCVGCHNATLTGGGVRLDSYTEVSKSVQSGSLLGSIKHETGYKAMPQNQDKLDDCTIAKIEAWINDGAQNN